MGKRIDIITSFIRPCSVFADVGCDHGKVAIAAMKCGECGQVVAADVSADSLKKAVDLAENEGLKGLIAVLSDGFDKIDLAVDEAVIAGMGGEEICKILKRRDPLPDRLILQPMKNADKVRRFLVEEKAFPITDDFTFFDGEKYYELIVADRSQPFRTYSERDIAFGKDNDATNEDFLRYCKNLSRTYRAALAVIGEGKTADELREKLKAVEEFLKDENN